MSLYAEYKREREGKLVVEDKDSFIVYSISGDICYIEDVYIVPEKRRKRLCFQLADYVVGLAVQKGCKTLLGSVQLDPFLDLEKRKQRNNSLQMLLSYGMIVYSSGDNIVYFSKEIQ